MADLVGYRSTALRLYGAGVVLISVPVATVIGLASLSC